MNGTVIILRMTTRQTMWNALTIPWWFVALLRSSKHAKCYSYHAQTIFRQLFRQDFPMTFPWLLIKSLTFHWKLSNSLTFPGFPDKWSPLIFVLALIMKIALYSIITFWALWISTLLSWKILFFCGKWRATTASAGHRLSSSTWMYFRLFILPSTKSIQSRNSAKCNASPSHHI